MGYNVEDSPCLSQNETCTFSLVNVSSDLSLSFLLSVVRFHFNVQGI